MKVAIFALIFACYQYAEAGNWAVLVAGSTGYGNYRHQADIAHAYQLVKSKGIPASNIITMMYDDVARNRRNPYKNNLINVPGGPNVYAGIRVDYRGRDCNARNFLAVLEGNRAATSNGGRVLQSGSGDNVFVYYADHGNKQLIAMPGGVLYSRYLLNTINKMHSANRYKNLVFYIEACFSGSMFYRRRLPPRVYAMTAANERESSYSCYYDRTRRTYLSDEYSAQWMADSEKADFRSHTLNSQWRNVNRYVRMSHVMQYGDNSVIGNMPIGAFQGAGMASYNGAPAAPLPPITDSVPTWEVPYMSLLHQLQDANTTESRMEILHEMRAEQGAQLRIKESMKSIVEQIVPYASSMMQPMETATTEEQDHCYEQAVDKYTQACKAFQDYDYAMRDLHVFANLCNRGENIDSITAAIEQVCNV